MKKIISLAGAGLCAVLLSACGGGGDATSAAQQDTPSTNQVIYEKAELAGGLFSLSTKLPYGGGQLRNNTHYFFSSSTGGLQQSPTFGPQRQTEINASLSDSLSLPTIASNRYLLNGTIYTRSTKATRLVSYVGSDVRIDYLADDGTTVVQSNLFTNFQEIPLRGALKDAPHKLQADVPLWIWLAGNNLQNRTWQEGAAFVTRQGRVMNDAYTVVDCPSSDVTASGTPTICGSGTLENFFPKVLWSSSTKPRETYKLNDGTISVVQGVRTWVSNYKIQPSTEAYRVFFELNGNIYAGQLIKAGTAYRYMNYEGTIVDYRVDLNQAAVNTIKAALVVNALPGTTPGNSNTLSSLDVYGMGGTAINGALGPADLRSLYNVPTSLDGKGQTVAIVDAPGSASVLDDLNAYSRAFGLPECNSSNPCFEKIDLGGTPTSSMDWGSEIDLDVQMVHALAPAAKIVLVVAKSNSSEDLTAALIQAAQIPGVTSVSLSWGGSGNYPAMEQALVNGVTQNGVSFFASSGDGGGSINPLYPAAFTTVTAVGGTVVNSLKRSATNEQVWRYSGTVIGGVSLMPTYQIVNGQFVPTCPQSTWQSAWLGYPACTYGRVYPDVSAVADFQHSPVAVYWKQTWIRAGGTSASAPIWAGLSALMAQYMAQNGQNLNDKVKATKGGLNGLLYAAGYYSGNTTFAARPAGAQAAGFYDVSSGTVATYLPPLAAACTPGYLSCTAAKGFDNVSGLGTPNLTDLLPRL